MYGIIINSSESISPQITQIFTDYLIHLLQIKSVKICAICGKKDIISCCGLYLVGLRSRTDLESIMIAFTNESAIAP